MVAARVHTLSQHLTAHRMAIGLNKGLTGAPVLGSSLFAILTFLFEFI